MRCDSGPYNVLMARKTVHLHTLSNTALDGHNDGHISVISWEMWSQTEVLSN